VKLWAALSRAWRGWLLLLRGDPAWAQHFTPTNAGLAAALAIFFLVAFLSVAFASLSVGMPNLFGIASALVVQGLSILALLLAIKLTNRVLATPTPLRTLLVPGIYALVAYLLAGTLVSLMGGRRCCWSGRGLAICFIASAGSRPAGAEAFRSHLQF
jgi:hypothetical protein